MYVLLRKLSKESHPREEWPELCVLRKSASLRYGEQEGRQARLPLHTYKPLTI